jgi:transposase
MPQTRFTKEFQDEAVRLALTSGRSRRAIAEDLGVGLSTLRNWIDRRRERQIDDPPADRQEDMVVELKRLRRENEILRQERDILKRATANGMDRPCSRVEHGRAGLSRRQGAMPCHIRPRLRLSPPSESTWARTSFT